MVIGTASIILHMALIKLTGLMYVLLNFMPMAHWVHVALYYYNHIMTSPLVAGFSLALQPTLLKNSRLATIMVSRFAHMLLVILQTGSYCFYMHQYLKSVTIKDGELSTAR